MTKMNELYQTIEALANDRQTERTSIQERIDAQKGIIAQAADEASEAFNNEDVKAYHAAQDKQRSAQDAIQMLEAKLAKVKEAPRLTAEEYSNLEAQIRAEFAAVTDKISEEIEKHIAAIAALKPELIEAFQTGEKALHLLQFDVQNDAPYITNGNGQKVPVTVGEKHLQAYSLYDHVESEAGKQLIDHVDRRW